MSSRVFIEIAITGALSFASLGFGLKMGFDAGREELRVAQAETKKYVDALGRCDDARRAEQVDAATVLQNLEKANATLVAVFAGLDSLGESTKAINARLDEIIIEGEDGGEVKDEGSKAK